MIDVTTYKKHIYDVVGALHEVHKELGAGLNESCYQEGLRIQLEEQGIEYSKELSFHPSYHGRQMESMFRVDFLCKGDIVIECKAVEELVSNHRAQLFNYMRILSCPCGILVNFSPRYAEIERYFLDLDTNEIVGADGIIKQFL
jgi:GxxExxY protein